MKKPFVAVLLLLSVISISGINKVQAQNLQLFYDAGRGCATTTVEMFRPDAGGSTFFFIDFDYSPKATGAYWEIARELNFWHESKVSWLSVHLEYNGGLNVGTAFNNSFLGGLTYSGHSKDFTKTWSVSVMYKAIPGTLDVLGRCQMHNFQITGVWGIEFAKGWCKFSGFADFWREHRHWQGTEFIFMTEPQFWVNLDKIKGWENIHLSVGGELELSANFVAKGFHAMPAVGAKWTF